MSKTTTKKDILLWGLQAGEAREKFIYKDILAIREYIDKDIKNSVVTVNVDSYSLRFEKVSETVIWGYFTHHITDGLPSE